MHNMLNTIGVDFVYFGLLQKVKFVDKNGEKIKVVLVTLFYQYSGTLPGRSGFGP